MWMLYDKLDENRIYLYVRGRMQNEVAPQQHNFQFGQLCEINLATH
jgi:hypothetical protein